MTLNMTLWITKYLPHNDTNFYFYFVYPWFQYDFKYFLNDFSLGCLIERVFTRISFLIKWKYLWKGKVKNEWHLHCIPFVKSGKHSLSWFQRNCLKPDLKYKYRLFASIGSSRTKFLLCKVEVIQPSSFFQKNTRTIIQTYFNPNLGG